MEFRKDSYVLCKYRGKNGDLIVGRIITVGRTGIVDLVDLLERKSRRKKMSVLSHRNFVVSKKVANDVVRFYRQTRDKAATRQLAVEKVIDLRGRSPRNVVSPPETRTGVDNLVRELVGMYESLDDQGKRAFARRVWADVLATFGVD